MTQQNQPDKYRGTDKDLLTEDPDYKGKNSDIQNRPEKDVSYDEQQKKEKGTKYDEESRQRPEDKEEDETV